MNCINCLLSSKFTFSLSKSKFVAPCLNILPMTAVDGIGCDIYG